MEKFSEWLIIAAIFSALFSDKIDKAVKGDKQVKKVILVFSAGALLICAIPIIMRNLS